ncbi:TRAP transporter small permease [Kiloniella laminariae]|uniref:TRAP transporter small permease protein n=1 Tax=Kiloniella laminariae TaxID=454162 RepID=A0ABT4LN26_9PROT|nr:TRAP transporter small permease [Kiloniella laminariae]MCZ4282471.1 TRAP transporter small permease [Kiloniella laminariae]
MRQILNKLYQASGWAAAFFLLAICITVIAQVLLNLIDRLSTAITGEAIGLTIPSYGDFTGFFLAASSFLALAYTLRDGSHIRVSLLLQNLPQNLRRVIEIWCLVVAATMALFCTYYTGLLVHEAFTYNDLSTGMIAVPIWLPMTPMLVGLGILAIALLDELVTVLRGGEASYEGKGENLLQQDHADLHAE